MRVINVTLYGTAFFLWLYGKFGEEKKLPGAGKVNMYMKRYVYLLVILLIFNTLSLAFTFKKTEQLIYIERDGYAGEEKSIGLILRKGEEEQKNELTVERRKLTDEQAKEKMTEAFEALDKTMLGKNESWENINDDLDFSLDVQSFPFDADFAPADYGLINGEGHVKNSEDQLNLLGYKKEAYDKGIATNVRVTLWYGEGSSEKIYEMRVFPREKSELEKQFVGVMEALKKEEKLSEHDEGFFLPVVVDGINVERADSGGLSPEIILIAGIVVSVLLFLREEENKIKEEKIRQEKLRQSYSWFVNEMLLLLGAGMQVKHIFALMAAEGGNTDKNRTDVRAPLIAEISKAKQNMDNGMPEEQAYYLLGRRLKLSCYIKLMTILEQNVKKGSKGITEIFEREEAAALEERKNIAKRSGEEAGTKLLGPMILLLIVVMFIIMIPAFMSFV